MTAQLQPGEKFLIMYGGLPETETETIMIQVMDQTITETDGVFGWTLHYGPDEDHLTTEENTNTVPFTTAKRAGEDLLRRTIEITWAAILEAL